MDKVSLLARIGIGLALIDFILRGFGPLYTTSADQSLGLEHFIGVAIIPIFAVASSMLLLKNKKWGLYLAIILALISLLGSMSILRGGELNTLAVLYLLIYGVAVFLGFQQSKSLK